MGSLPILDYLRDRIGLVADDTPFLVVVRAAESLTWTRDPFDRMITASASAGDHPLLTSDKRIRSHYREAIWDDAPHHA